MKLTSAQLDRLHDEKLWDLSIALVRAYDDWQTAQKEFGPFSSNAKEAYKEAMRLFKRFKRLNNA